MRKPINKYTEQSATNTFYIHPDSLHLEHIHKPKTIYMVQDLPGGKKQEAASFFALFVPSVKS